jgi:integrase
MSQGKQAKVLTEKDIARVLREVGAESRYPVRDTVTVLLSVRAGLRAIEIANVRWESVLDQDGNVGTELELQDRDTKGKKGGRVIDLHPSLRDALIALQDREKPARDARIVKGERDGTVSPAAIHKFFQRLYKALGLAGCSSHSGRRTFVTGVAKRIWSEGGTLKDVQRVAGHVSLTTTQRYIERDNDALRRAIHGLGSNGK